MWSFLSAKQTMITPETALPGRDRAMPVATTHFVNGHPLKAPFPSGIETAVFALGCFWGAERLFWELPGVYTTAVGYIAGFTKNPTYEEVCSGRTGHTEAVLVAFDPKAISYGDLLTAFWESHNPTQGMQQGNDVGTQYRSGIYVSSPEQRRLADRSKTDYETALKGSWPSADHHGDRRCRPVLLRRGLSPAVSGEESRRLLRFGRNRRELSNPVYGSERIKLFNSRTESRAAEKHADQA